MLQLWQVRASSKRLSQPAKRKREIGGIRWEIGGIRWEIGRFRRQGRLGTGTNVARAKCNKIFMLSITGRAKTRDGPRRLPGSGQNGPPDGKSNDFSGKERRILAA